MEINKNYDDIIFLEHHVSRNHPQMPLSKRAAQFAPFAALEGYKENIIKTTHDYEKQVLELENGKILFDDAFEDHGWD